MVSYYDKNAKVYWNTSVPPSNKAKNFPQYKPRRANLKNITNEQGDINHKIGSSCSSIAFFSFG